MNKLIQTIVLTAVVFSPLSLLSLVTSAAAHHTLSHTATVSLAGKKKPTVKNKKSKKSNTSSGVTDKKTTGTDEAPSTQSPATGAPTGDSSPVKTGDPYKTPPTAIPGTKSDPSGADSMSKPDSIKVPTSGAPTGAPSTAPSVPNSIPGGTPAPGGSPKY